MTSHIECVVEQHFPVAVTRLRGKLDIHTADQVRAHLLKCLVDQPAALVVDLAELDAVEDLALNVFAVICRRAADWPGAAVMLCAPGPNLAQALRRSPLTRFIPVYPTQREAVEEASLRRLPPRVREFYMPSRTAPQQARALVAKAATAWDLPGSLVPTLQVITSELVANAVVHAGTVLEFLMVLRDQLLHLSVRDGAPGQVRLRGAVSQDAEGGRGLLVVGALATAWGSVSTGAGKIVWATVRIRPSAAR
ncbi:MAG TPA: STAS domain-containing protein [Micromonosporaceae bacterium]|jgi:anti-anti-sigma factor|nr:STAS domain-containing protein [Micromonosporaceae bacterium]